MKQKIKDLRKLKNKIKLNSFTMQFVYLVLAVIFLLILTVALPKAWPIWLILLVGIISLAIFITNKEIKENKDQVALIESGSKGIIKNLFNNTKIPVMMLNERNELIWNNKKISFIITPENLESLLNQIDTKSKNNIYEINIDDNEYKVYESIIKIERQIYKVLYFIDKTEEMYLKKEIEEEKLSLGILVVDNYEEIFKGLEELEKSEIASKIEKKIKKWASENSGIASKFEKDKYLIAFKNKNLENMKNNQFEILTEISKVANNTKIPITISASISLDGKTIKEMYKFATSTLDIALGRGGNQIVVKENNKYDFYGEAAINLEKISKVRARTISQAVKDLIQKSDRVYIMGHKNSDTDCIGSAVGFYKIAESLDTPAYIISDLKYNESTRNLVDKIKKNKEYEGVFLEKDDLKKCDFENSLLIIVDTHKKSYLAVPEVLDECENVVLVDHHRRGPEFIDNAIITYHEVYASSASELVTELLMYNPDVKLTPVEAEALYAGILVDTKNFTFKTGVRTFEAAAYLRKVGLDIAEVKQIFQNNFESYLAKMDIIKNSEFINKEIVISVCDKEMDNLSVISAQAADELLSISEVLASFVLCKIDNVVMISGRSMGDINVQLILEKLGGGGHLTFAGAQLAGVELDEAKEILIEAINSYYNKEEK